MAARRGIHAFDTLRECGRGVVLTSGCTGDDIRACRKAAQRTAECAADRRLSRVRPSRPLVKPVAHRCDVAAGQHVPGKRHFRQCEQRHAAQARVVQKRSKMAAYLFEFVLGHAVEHDADLRCAFVCDAQQMPRHRIGVAGGRRHEQPHVGRAEQAYGEIAVGVDRVDVGDVEDGEPGRHTVVHVQNHRGPLVGRPRSARDPAKAGQHARAGEPVPLRCAAHHDGDARGGTQDPCGADLAPDERVDQRRTPRSRGTADHGEQRGLGAAQSGQDVVVDLGDEFAPGAAGFVGAGKIEGQAGVVGLVPDAGDRLGKTLALVHRVITTSAPSPDPNGTHPPVSVTNASRSAPCRVAVTWPRSAPPPGTRPGRTRGGAWAQGARRRTRRYGHGHEGCATRSPVVRGRAMQGIRPHERARGRQAMHPYPAWARPVRGSAGPRGAARSLCVKRPGLPR